MEQKEGILLFGEHASWLWQGKKGLIIKPKNYEEMVDKALYVCDDRYVYGVIRLHKPVLIDDLEEERNVHLVSDEDAGEWFEGDELWLYSFDWVKKFNQPLRADFKKGKHFTTGIEFIQEDSVGFFPPDLLKFFKENLEEWGDYVIHHRCLADRVLTDMKFDVGEHLQGFTLFSTELDSPEELKGGFNQSTWSKNWLNFEGNSDNGFCFIIGKGQYMPIELQDHSIVMKIRSEKGNVNKSLVEQAREADLRVPKNLSDNYVTMWGRYAFHITDPNGKYILFDKIVGRPKGTSELNGEQLKKLWNMSKEKCHTRGKIANELGLSKKTVWKYQKRLGFL